MASPDLTTEPVAGRYELVGLLGRGGMGSVWRAQDLLLQRPVAVKRVELPLNLPPADREALRQRVLREARAAARVSHPRLVTIFDVVEEEGTVFLVQELVDAPTLKAVVTDRGPLPPPEVARIGRQLVEGLAAAHRNGVVHRDVKPSNVMLLPDGSVKLADFGIASLHGDPQLTATGVVIGSPAYMAPEQATGAQVGPAGDLWSLGATLYFAVEGEPPFGRADTLSTLTAVVHEPARPTVLAGPLAPVLAHLLAKEPLDRPEAGAVASRLGDLGEAPVQASADGPTEARAPGYTAVGTTVVTPAPEPSHEPARSDPSAAAGTATAGSQGRRPLAVITVLVAIALVAGLALAALAGRGDDASSSLAAPPESQGAPAENGDGAEAEGDDGGGLAADEAADGATPRPATPRAATPTTAPDAAAAPTAAVPAGWTTYRDPASGYAVAHPPGWQVKKRDGTRTDFTDPASGTYLRVDWTDDPGPSAQQAWVDQSKSFGKRQENYREIRIEPTTFKGSKNASLWEYTYTGGGAALHAYNLGFVVGDDYGFALNFQTRESDWAASQPLWEQLKGGFRPPG